MSSSKHQSAGATSDTVVRAQPLVRYRGRYYPAGGGEPLNGYQPAGQTSEQKGTPT